MSSASSDLTPLRLAWLGFALAGAAVSVLAGEGLWAQARPGEILAQLVLALWCQSALTRGLVMAPKTLCLS